MLELIAVFVGGFITGILVGRNNVKLVEKSVEEAIELYEKAQAEIAELKAPKKKSTKRKTAVKKSATKKTSKKPQVD